MSLCTKSAECMYLRRKNGTKIYRRGWRWAYSTAPSQSLHEQQRAHQGFVALVHYVLFVDLLKNIRTDHSMEVCLHVLEDEIDVAVVVCLKHILKFYDVLVLVHLWQR